MGKPYRKHRAEAEAEAEAEVEVEVEVEVEAERIGMFHLAESLARETGEPRILWLQRIAMAVSGMKGAKKKFFKIDYFVLRGSATNENGVEDVGIVALKKLAEQNSFKEPEDIERMLKTIWFPADQVEAWRAELNLGEIDHFKSQEELWEQDAKKILEEHNTDKAIAVFLLLQKYGQNGTANAKPYLQVCEAGVMVGISGWPDDKGDKNGWKKYRGKVNRERKNGKKKLA